MHTHLLAQFSMDPKQVLSIADREFEDTGAVHDLLAYTMPPSKDAFVVGKTQEVMQLIGALASRGEATLERVVGCTEDVMAKARAHLARKQPA